MTIPDLGDRSFFPPFLELPEDHGGPTAPEGGSDHYLIAQIKDNMTITKPTLVLTDRDGHGFALVFDGLDRDGLDLGKLGLKKGATAVVRGARQTVPDQQPRLGDGDKDTMTAKAARRQFLRIAAGQAHTVQAVPTSLEQTVTIAAKLRERREREHQAPAGEHHCQVCGASGAAGTTTGVAASSEPERAAKKLLKCGGCGQAWYCDRTCQTKGWSNGHKGECKALKAIAAIWSE